MKRIIELLIFAVLLSACATSTPGVPTQVLPSKTITATKVPPASTPTASPTPAPLIGCVTASSSRIRNGPGTQYEVLGGLPSGTCVPILSKNGDENWVQVIFDGKTGWVSAEYLSITDELSNIPQGNTLTPRLSGSRSLPFYLCPGLRQFLKIQKYTTTHQTTLPVLLQSVTMALTVILHTAEELVHITAV